MKTVSECKEAIAAALKANEERLFEQSSCEFKHMGRICSQLFTCCDCGSSACGCAYCFACNACDECLTAVTR